MPTTNQRAHRGDSGRANETFDITATPELRSKDATGVALDFIRGLRESSGEIEVGRCVDSLVARGTGSRGGGRW